jgi:hypothetical protein
MIDHLLKKKLRKGKTNLKDKKILIMANRHFLRDYKKIAKGIL